jgi:hypothetical protein
VAIGCSQHDSSSSVPFTTMISVSHFSQRNLVPAAVGMQRRIPNRAGHPASWAGDGGERLVFAVR